MDEVNGARTPASVPVSMEDLMRGFKPAPGNLSYASSLNVLRTGNDFVLVFQRPRPGTVKDGVLAPFAVIENGEMIALSVKTVKDLHRVLGEHLAAYEREFGAVETDFTRRMDEQARTLPPAGPQQ